MKTARNLWPIGVTAAFAIFIAGTAGLIVFASSQSHDLVSDNYYEQELRYQQRIDSLDRTARLGADASVVYDSVRRRIVISLPPGQVGDTVSGRIDLYRPSAARLDQELKLAPDVRGVQQVDAAALQPGLWKIRVSWTAANEDYYLDQEVVIAR